MTQLAKPLTITVLTICMMAAHQQASAELNATDSYRIGPNPTDGEYLEAQLNAQPADLTVMGFANGGYGLGTGTAQFQATTISLNSTVGGLGGKVTYSSAPLDSIYRAVARATDPIPGNGTYYMSHTVNRGDIPQAGGDGFALTGFGNFVPPERGPTAGFLAGVFVGFTQNASNPNSFGDLVLRARTTTSQSAEDIVLVDGSNVSTVNQSYTVVIRVEITGSVDAVAWWLDPTDFSNGEAGLTSSSTANGSFSSFAFGGASDLQRLTYASRDWNGNAFFDEARLGTSVDNLVLVEKPLLGDINGDGLINLLDVQPFVDLLTNNLFQVEADINGDGVVDLLDVQPFVDLLNE